MVIKEFNSVQMKNVEVVETPVDADAAAKRLSKAITYRTISNQDRSDFDEQAYNEFHKYLVETYPLVHKILKREILGSPRAFSLLYTWEGKNPSLPPVVLLAHQDVVPAVPGTEKQWEHDAYSGDIADGYIWGRGSLDDKIMILAILEAVEMQLKESFQPTRTFYLVFGQDEEVMGTEGVKHVVEVLKSRGVNEVALVLDEGLPLTVGLFAGGGATGMLTTIWLLLVAASFGAVADLLLRQMDLRLSNLAPPRDKYLSENYYYRVDGECGASSFNHKSSVFSGKF